MKKRLHIKPPSARTILLATLFLTLSGTSSMALEPIRLHPANNRYFIHRNQPVVLVGSSEHYGALVNLDFDYIPYLDEARNRGLNLIRIFSGTYRESPGAFGIQDNTLAPPTARFIAPWKRTSAPGAIDGGTKFDLNQWEPAYFSRLRNLVAEAGKRGIVVELTFYSAIYDDNLWKLSPMNGGNHINGAGFGGRINCFAANNDLLPYQKSLARKCATELNAYDNVIYEICNEPYNGSVSPAWENQIIDELASTEASLPARHMIARNVFNYQGVISNPHPAVSIFNFHYAYPEAALLNYGLNRAIGDDETGFAGQTDFPYRREAWEFMMSGGALFNHLDFSFTTSREDGTAIQSAPGGGGIAIRRQLGVLRGFLENLPLVQIRPLTNIIAGGVPGGGAARAIGVSGSAYGIYLRGGSKANLILNLPAGTYQGNWIDTKTGAVAAVVGAFSHVGGQRTLPSPGYQEDIALRLTGVTAPPPATAPQILTNGSFESDFTGWTRSGNQVIQSAVAYAATDGIRLVAFNGGNTTPNGVIAQTFSTTAGVTYTLTFDAGVFSYNASEQRLQLTVNGSGPLLSQMVSITGTGNGGTRWVRQNFSFVANSGSTTLTFRDQSVFTNALDLLLDNVRVTAGGTVTNTAPVAVADTYSTTKNTTLVVAANGVLGNDTDAQSHPLTAVLKSNPANGTVSLSSNGGFTYTPASNFTGSDSFTYYAHDGSLSSNVVSTSITVNPHSSVGLVNGSFESGFSGWTVTGNSFIAASFPYMATHGAKLVAFNNANLPANAVISQSFVTTAGVTYTLDFDIGVLAYNGNSQTLQILVIGGSTLLSRTTTLHGSGVGTRWESRNFTFVANSGTTTLTFRDLSASTNSLDMLLDDVQVAGP